MGVVVAQGAAFVAAGAAAQVVTPASVIAAGGGIGAVAAVGLTLSWRRLTSPPRPTCGRFTPPGQPRVRQRAGSSSTLTAPVRRESFSVRTASSQRSSGKRCVMTGVRSRPSATKSK